MNSDALAAILLKPKKDITADDIRRIVSTDRATLAEITAAAKPKRIRIPRAQWHMFVSACRGKEQAREIINWKRKSVRIARRRGGDVYEPYLDLPDGVDAVVLLRRFRLSIKAAVKRAQPMPMLSQVLEDHIAGEPMPSTRRLSDDPHARRMETQRDSIEAYAAEPGFEQIAAFVQ